MGKVHVFFKRPFLFNPYLFAAGDRHLLQLPIAELGVRADGQTCGWTEEEEESNNSRTTLTFRS